jgi:RNA binding exosome subunit
MADLPIRWIEARTYCHATEEEERVATALAFAVPEGDTSREAFEGHFGNPLVRLTRRVEKRPGIRAVWDRWSSAELPAAIARNLEARLDEEGVLHFRLDKQAAYRENVSLAEDSDAIDIRLKLIAYPAKPEVARRVARSILAEAP